MRGHIHHPGRNVNREPALGSLSPTPGEPVSVIEETGAQNQFFSGSYQIGR
jgi:hypothetical protein